MKIGIIACVKDKMKFPARAEDMYVGGDFKFWKEDALNQQNVDRYFILSAKYGLLLPEQMIEPYDLNLKDQTGEYIEKWSENLTNKLSELTNTGSDHYVIYTNNLYAKPIVELVKSYEIPFEIN